MTNSTTLTQEFIEFRALTRMTLRDFATATGFSSATLMNILKGKHVHARTERNMRREMARLLDEQASRIAAVRSTYTTV